MNLLGEKDFVTVAPGTEFDPCNGIKHPYQYENFPPTNGGTYTFRYLYSTNTKLVDDYYGVGVSEINPKKAKRLFERVPKLELMSNEVKLVFK